ncbi:thiamine diphosphokinase [Allofustis seminis]|uniref:thiamine diphosphokinase n=1 Tax=Allofustis seminis TaxID=166939 RepID=UPI0003676D55|nr:thiamine diphosphokinase [Allofustis seminis]
MNIHLVLGGVLSPNFELNMYSSEDQLIGVDRGAFRLISAGYSIDLAIGDFDSVCKEELQLIQSRSKEVKIFPSEKDDTDTELALSWVIENYPELHNIYMYGWNGGRVDHFLSVMYLAYQPKFKNYIQKIRWVDDHNIGQFYLPGNHMLHFDKRFTYFSIITLTPVRALTISGAKYNLKATDLDYPRAFISNEFVSRNCNISFDEGTILVLQTRDGVH